MSKTLFIGCSHTMGYSGYIVAEDKKPNVWGENNYAEIYSKKFNKDVIIMASAGAGNSAFPRFLAHALKTYKDIDEVFIQSTYWGRFPVVINPDLDEKDIFPLDFFLQKDNCDENIDRWSISLSIDNKYLEHYIKPQPQDWEIFKYNKDTVPWISEPDTRRSSHMYMQMWHYQNTHLIQQDYFKDIALCDMLCHYNNIPLYVWNINDRCYIPKQSTNFYTELRNTKFCDQDAISFLDKKYNKQHKNDTLDGEHYSKHVHEKIAIDYIPYVKDLQ